MYMAVRGITREAPKLYIRKSDKVLYNSPVYTDYIPVYNYRPYQTAQHNVK
jgi:hypothetical protein